MPFKKLFRLKTTKPEITLDPKKIPKHVAIIMDGNGRWAKKRHLPRIAGHKAGGAALKRAVLFCDRIGIKYLSVYVFSTENWKRPKSEVDFLMASTVITLRQEIREIHQRNGKLNFLGQLEALPKKVQQEFKEAAELTKDNTRLNLNILINYGSRAEILRAVNNIIEDKNRNKIDIVDENTFSKYLYTKDIPDPDLLIRTGGDFRISNFLLWQLAYTEIYVTDIFWPDFDDHIFTQAIHDFQNRERRFGGVLKG